MCGALCAVGGMFHAPLPWLNYPGCRLLPAHLPARVQVISVSGAADSGKAEKAAQLRWEGRSLVQALEAVERELAPAAL